MTRYLIHLLIALDCVGTALLGGWPGETLSSYAYRLDQQGKPGGRLCRPAAASAARRSTGCSAGRASPAAIVSMPGWA